MAGKAAEAKRLGVRRRTAGTLIVLRNKWTPERRKCGSSVRDDVIIESPEEDLSRFDMSANECKRGSPCASGIFLKLSRSSSTQSRDDSAFKPP